MRVENPIHPASMMPVGYEPVESLPADFFERTVAISRGPVGSPEAGYSAVVDFMHEGYAIEKNPEPIATGVFEAPSPEAVLDSIVEAPDSDAEPQTSRFQPYELHMDYDTQDSTLPKGITLVSEEGIVKPVLAEADPEGAEASEASETRGKKLLTALRRSRLGQLAAVTAIATGELLSLGAGSAKGADAQLEQECVQAALKKPKILKVGIKHAGRKNQAGMLNAWYGAMPEECYDEYRRSSSARVQSLRNGKWVNISFEEGVANQSYDSNGNFNPMPQTAFKGEFFQTPTSHVPDYWYRPCRARIVLREVVSHPQQNSDSGYHPNPPIDSKLYMIRIPPNKIRPHSFRRNHCN